MGVNSNGGPGAAGGYAFSPVAAGMMGGQSAAGAGGVNIGGHRGLRNDVIGAPTVQAPYPLPATTPSTLWSGQPNILHQRAFVGTWNPGQAVGLPQGWGGGFGLGDPLASIPISAQPQQPIMPQQTMMPQQPMFTGAAGGAPQIATALNTLNAAFGAQQQQPAPVNPDSLISLLDYVSTPFGAYKPPSQVPQDKLPANAAELKLRAKTTLQVLTGIGGHASALTEGISQVAEVLTNQYSGVSMLSMDESVLYTSKHFVSLMSEMTEILPLLKPYSPLHARIERMLDDMARLVSSPIYAHPAHGVITLGKVLTTPALCQAGLLGGIGLARLQEVARCAKHMSALVSTHIPLGAIDSNVSTEMDSSTVTQRHRTNMTKYKDIKDICDVVDHPPAFYTPSDYLMAGTSPGPAYAELRRVYARSLHPTSTGNQQGVMDWGHAIKHFYDLRRFTIEAMDNASKNGLLNREAHLKGVLKHLSVMPLMQLGNGKALQYMHHSATDIAPLHPPAALQQFYCTLLSINAAFINSSNITD